MILEITHLKKSYTQGGKTLQVLRELNFHVRAGEVVAIVGPSGSGKSTLLSLMAGLDRPDSGQIFFLGKDLATLSEKELTHFRGENLGIVFQQFHLIPHLTAWENIHLPLEILGRFNPDKVAWLLEQVGLKERALHFPDQMSGGECQRVALARALIAEPKLVLADEPTGNLDTQTAHQVMALLFDLVRKQNRTLILVTHNESLAWQCDRVQTLKDGVLV